MSHSLYVDIFITIEALWSGWNKQYSHNCTICSRLCVIQINCISFPKF